MRAGLSCCNRLAGGAKLQSGEEDWCHFYLGAAEPSGLKQAGAQSGSAWDIAVLRTPAGSLEADTTTHGVPKVANMLGSAQAPSIRRIGYCRVRKERREVWVLPCSTCTLHTGLLRLAVMAETAARVLIWPARAPPQDWSGTGKRWHFSRTIRLNFIFVNDLVQVQGRQVSPTDSPTRRHHFCGSRRHPAERWRITDCTNGELRPHQIRHRR